MAWIESHQELARHPKVRKLARRLSISEPAAVGHLHFLWWWAVDYAPDGSLDRHDDEDIAVGAMWDGVPADFVRALIDCGWLDGDERATHVHDWDDYAGRLIERRARNAQRMKDARAAHVPEASQATVPDLTEPNQTEPDQTVKPPSPAPDPMFDNCWEQYPPRNGKKLAKEKANAAWGRLTKVERGQALTAVEHYSDACKRGLTIAKDAHRWLRDKEFEDWLTPAEARASPNGYRPYANAPDSEYEDTTI